MNETKFQGRIPMLRYTNAIVCDVISQIVFQIKLSIEWIYLKKHINIAGNEPFERVLMSAQPLP